jgi:hypothetical protein
VDESHGVLQFRDVLPRIKNWFLSKWFERVQTDFGVATDPEFVRKVSERKQKE